MDKVGDRYYDGEHPLVPWVQDRVIALVETGHAVVGEPNPASGNRQPVTVTASGRARYEDLCERQGIAAYPAAVADGGVATPKTGNQ